MIFWKKTTLGLSFLFCGVGHVVRKHISTNSDFIRIVKKSTKIMNVISNVIKHLCLFINSYYIRYSVNSFRWNRIIRHCHRRMMGFADDIFFIQELPISCKLISDHSSNQKPKIGRQKGSFLLKRWCNEGVPKYFSSGFFFWGGVAFIIFLFYF